MVAKDNIWCPYKVLRLFFIHNWPYLVVSHACPSPSPTMHTPCHHACPPLPPHMPPHMPPHHHTHPPPCMPSSTMHAPLPPCTPPATMHAPLPTCMPPTTMHAPLPPCMPPYHHTCPPATTHPPCHHACPPCGQKPWHTLLKTLPCPTPPLRAVIMLFNIRLRYWNNIQSNSLIRRYFNKQSRTSETFTARSGRSCGRRDTEIGR